MKKAFWWLGGGLIIGVWLSYWGNSSSRGIIQKKEIDLRKDIKIGVVEYSDENISFWHEDKYTIEKSDNKLVLTGKSGVPSSMVITQINDFSGNIEDVPGVKMRLVKNKEYKEEKISGGLLFSKFNPYELVAFFIVKGRPLTVAMTVNSNDETKYREEFEELIKTIGVK
jgi:hypothetical protein